MLLAVFLVEIVLAESSSITLHMKETNAFAGVQGYVLYSKDHLTSFVSGSFWEYGGAVVVCKELGELLYL